MSKSLDRVLQPDGSYKWEEVDLIHSTKKVETVVQPEPVEEPVKKEVVMEDLEPVEIPVFFQLGSYSVMLADGKYNLRVGLQLLMSNEPANFFLNARMPLIKDALNEFLPGLTGEKLNSEEGRDEMRLAVIKKIHEVFPEEEVPGGDPWPIRELLFDEFVLTLAY